MKSGKKDTLLLLSIVLAIAGAIMVAYAFAQPRMYEGNTNSYSAEASDMQSAEGSFSVSQTTLKVTYPLNINTATAEELMTIDGIGEKRAYAIVDYREQIGGYTSVEQIKNIYGIGDSVYSNIAGYLTV